ncbi:MAG: hypothetical protein S4CHLAM123_06560 [Chlamydiales bacterium]|nr:hypothetical protein [Chlamydiales bacterium]
MASELDEADFVQEKNPKYVWIFLIIFIFISLLAWGLGIWLHKVAVEKRNEFAFYRVTNREFSLFLWQHPDFMHSDIETKLENLPHFHSQDEIQVVPQYADMYVIASIDLLFRYHVWNRLLGKTLAPRPIPADEFYTFIHENQEWLPTFWAKAPKEYKKLLLKLPKMEAKDIQGASKKALPFEVRLAFQGWKNITREWKSIEDVNPNYAQMQAFLAEHPHYRRSYWRNLEPDYLVSFTEEEVGELSDFLKIGYYNYVVSTQRG